MKKQGILLVIVAVLMTGCIIVPAGGHRGYYEHNHDRGSHSYDRGSHGHDRGYYRR